MFVKFLIFMVLFILAIQCVSSMPYLKESSASMCHLPEDKGRCRALIPRWRYDLNSKQCKMFNYGGCAGNINNFPTKDICVDKCQGS